MFGLIPMVITIILAAIVAGAFAYFGGDIYSDSSISAKANGLVNEGSQIRSASQLFRVKEAAWPASVEALVTGTYLGGEPSHTYTIGQTDGKITAVSGDAANTADLTADVCSKINESATGTSALPVAEPTGQLFGCFAAATGIAPFTFVHK